MKHDLHDVCTQIRRDTVRSIYRAGSGHPGSSLSAVEIMATLYFTDYLYPVFLTGPMRRNGTVLSYPRAMRPRLITAFWPIRAIPPGLARYAADGWQCSPGASQFGKNCPVSTALSAL